MSTKAHGTKAWALEMALYNKWQNEKLYGFCDALSDAVRTQDRGLYFGSIHRTLDHILMVDRVLWDFTLSGQPPRDWYYALMDYGSLMVKQGPNPNRKSAHHSVQSKFSGSNRQLRGNILKRLVKGAMPAEALGLELQVDRERFDAALAALQNEGFLTASDDMVGLS